MACPTCGGANGVYVASAPAKPMAIVSNMGRLPVAEVAIGHADLTVSEWDSEVEIPTGWWLVSLAYEVFTGVPDNSVDLDGVVITDLPTGWRAQWGTSDDGTPITTPVVIAPGTGGRILVTYAIAH